MGEHLKSNISIGEFNMVGNQICKKCFKEMRFGYTIIDEIWNKLPEKWHNKVLCIDCFLEELEKVFPKQKISLNDFYFMGILGDYDNNDFGGILIDSDNKKNIRIFLGD